MALASSPAILLLLLLLPLLPVPLTAAGAAEPTTGTAAGLPGFGSRPAPAHGSWKTRRSSALLAKKRLYIDGDVIVGALFPMHKQPPRSGSADAERPCGEIWEQYGIHRVETFLMTLDQINRDPHVLPDVTLGCDVRDSCWDVQTSLRECKNYIRTSLVQEIDYTSAAAGEGTAADRCGGGGSLLSSADGLLSKPIAALIGAGSSQVSMQVQDMLQLFSIPQLDYAATSVDLSDKSRYRYFLRVAPPDSQQAMALANFVEHFGWTYISTVYSDGTYGSSGMDTFNKVIRDRGICVATAEHASSVDNDQRYDEIMRNMQKTPNAKVIVCFCEGATINGLFRSMKRLGENGFLIVGSDGWNTRPDVVKDVHDVAVGSFSIKMDSPAVPGFDEYFFGLTPQNNSRNPWFSEFWEFRFSCDLPRSDSMAVEHRKYNRTCTGQESLQQGYDVDAKLGFLVNAMYAMALGLNAMQIAVCGSNRGSLCDAMLPINGSMFLQYLKQVNFTTYSNQSLFFNENGDPPGKYLYMNYQLVNGSYTYRQVGSWEAGTFALGESLVQWKLPPGDRSSNNSSIDSPESVCSYPCAHGYIKKAQPQLSRCCWLCEKCPANAILAGNDTCIECPPGQWPDINLTECLKLPITHIQWTDVDAALPVTLACIGLAITVATLAVFARHNRTAVVKASTRELSYMMLVGIALAHVSTFAFIARPTMASCYVTRILPGLCFAVVYGAVLTKTNRIARILSRSKRIALDKPRCMTTSSLAGVTAGLVAVEAAISAAMLAWQPAEAVVIYPNGGRVALLVCNTTAYGVLGPLGFDFLLILLCTFYAVKTRNVPANFNEAKFIGFAMYTTCVIWVGFVAIYFGSDSKVMTMTLSITLSATVALVLLFGQKIYIILWKPEKNQRSAFTTTSKDVRCHIGRAAASAIECSAKLVTVNYSNGGLPRNVSSGSLNSSSSRLVAIQQRAPKPCPKSAPVQQHTRSRDSHRYSAIGASLPDSQYGSQSTARGELEWQRDEADDRPSAADGSMEMSLLKQRSVACQTDQCDHLVHQDSGSALATSSGCRFRRHSSRSGSGSNLPLAKATADGGGGCSELPVIEDEEGQPLLESTAVNGSAAPALILPMTLEARPETRARLVDVAANQLDIAPCGDGSVFWQGSDRSLLNGAQHCGSGLCCNGSAGHHLTNSVPEDAVCLSQLRREEGATPDNEPLAPPDAANSSALRAPCVVRDMGCHAGLMQSRSWSRSRSAIGGGSRDGSSAARASSWDSVLMGGTAVNPGKIMARPPRKCSTYAAFS